MSPLLIDLMIEPLIRWLRTSNKGYNIASCDLHLASKWYADDNTLVTNSMEDMISLLDLVDQFSKWSGIYLNANKCKIPEFVHDIQAIPRKRDRDDAFRAMLAHVHLAGHPIGSLTQDETLPGGYLGTSLTASLCPDAHLRWTKEQLQKISKALARAILPPHIKQCFLLYGAHSKIAHTYCLMALSPDAVKAIDSLLEDLSRKI
jgi:hypothetical protein